MLPPYERLQLMALLFSATNGSSTITATDNAHGAVINDFVQYQELLV